jgi:hypothetical protein
MAWPLYTYTQSKRERERERDSDTTHTHTPAAWHSTHPLVPVAPVAPRPQSRHPLTLSRHDCRRRGFTHHGDMGPLLWCGPAALTSCLSVCLPVVSVCLSACCVCLPVCPPTGSFSITRHPQQVSPDIHSKCHPDCMCVFCPSSFCPFSFLCCGGLLLKRAQRVSGAASSRACCSMHLLLPLAGAHMRA